MRQLIVKKDGVITGVNGLPAVLAEAFDGDAVFVAACSEGESLEELRIAAEAVRRQRRRQRHRSAYRRHGKDGLQNHE